MRSIRVSFGVTKNLGNYESARIEMEEAIDIPESSDVTAESVRAALLKSLQTEVNREASKLTGRR